MPRLVVHVLRWAAVPAALALLPAAASAQTINVQIINVCDDGGLNCALSNPYASTAYNPLAVQNIFKQAGVTVNLLAPVQFNSSAFLNPGVVDDPGNGYLTGNPTDPAHQLLSQGGHFQNTDPDVLNVYAVNSLPHTSFSGGSYTAAYTLFGLGLNNSNGAIVTTGVTPPDAFNKSYVAGIDNIAHELGHNLGLQHVDGTADASPYNLMQGIGRYVPTTLCGIVGTACDAGGTPIPSGSGIPVATTGLKDALNPGQIAQAQSSATNLFSAEGTTAFAETSEATIYQGCSTGVSACAVGVGIPGTGPFGLDPGTGTASLVGVRLRFSLLSSDPNVPDLTAALNPFFPYTACGAQFSNSRLPNGDAEIAVSFVPGCFRGPLDLGPDGTGIGDVYSQLFYIPVEDPNYAGVFNPVTPDYDLLPFSVQFQFSDGETTTSLFDSSGSATSVLPVAVGNVLTANQNGPGLFVPTDPALFNAVSSVEDEPLVIVTAGGVVPLFTDVPEPTSLGVLGVALLGVLGRRRR